MAPLVHSEGVMRIIIDDDDPEKNGLLLKDAILQINKLGGDEVVVIDVLRDACITKQNEVEFTPFKRCSAYRIFGLPVIKKNNVKIAGNGNAIFIAEVLRFHKVEQRLCRSSDEMAYLLSVAGNGFSLSDIHLEGNVERREIIRGAGMRGYGGEEFGLCLLGDDSVVERCRFEGFATDSIIIAGDAVMKELEVKGSGRNQISVVNLRDRHIHISGDGLNIVGAKGADFAVRPGSGLHVEANVGKATVTLTNSTVLNTLGSSIRLSVGSIDCLFTNVTTDGDVHIVDRKECNYGGHRFINSTIGGRVIDRAKRCDD